MYVCWVWGDGGEERSEEISGGIRAHNGEDGHKGEEAEGVRGREETDRWRRSERSHIQQQQIDILYREIQYNIIRRENYFL